MSRGDMQEVPELQTSSAGRTLGTHPEPPPIDCTASLIGDSSLSMSVIFIYCEPCHRPRAKELQFKPKRSCEGKFFKRLMCDRRPICHRPDPLALVLIRTGWFTWSGFGFQYVPLHPQVDRTRRRPCYRTVLMAGSRTSVMSPGREETSLNHQ